MDDNKDRLQQIHRLLSEMEYDGELSETMYQFLYNLVEVVDKLND